MSTKDFTANVISATKVVPDGNFKDSKASGIWDINEALDLIKGGNWPNAANLSPSAFVDGLFQTHLYTGTQQVQNITNGLDLSSKGGLVWLKTRSGTTAFGANMIFDTERGAQRVMRSQETGADSAANNTLTSFNTNGFSLGISTDGNKSGDSHVSWSFRKQPKFFDIVTYTGTGSAQTIAHSLGTTVGMLIIKRTDSSSSDGWICYHNGFSKSGDPRIAFLNSADEAFQANSTYLNNTYPTSTNFTVGESADVNASNGTYVAYLFAHNNNDGGFGEPGDQDIIKCGSYTGNASTDGPDVNLGFEPQWVMIKNATSSADWMIFDVMRGIVTGGNDALLNANDNDAENNLNDFFSVTSTGFKLGTIGYGASDSSGKTYVYMAIRRGGMQTPTAASDVFDVEIGGSSVADAALATTTGFPVDMFMHHDNYSSGGETFVVDRLRGRSAQVRTQVTNAEGTYSTNNPSLDSNSGLINRAGSTKNLSGGVYWQWRRARGYFDVVAYTGDGQAGRTVSHNLGVAPEMMWVKRRDSSTNGSWWVYHAGAQDSPTYVDVLALNSDGAVTDSSGYFAGNPTASNFSVNQYNTTNGSGNTYIAYLFATLSGVSKLGSYTGNAGASTINVDCGFTGDTPSFILIKESSGTGNWWVFDSARGIVAGTEKALYLNTTDAETSAYDYIDPYSGGFSLSINSGINTDGATFIFYAIAATS